MEEFSQFMNVEKPPEQTLEEFAEFMASSNHVRAQDRSRHITVNSFLKSHQLSFVWVRLIGSIGV